MNKFIHNLFLTVLQCIGYVLAGFLGILCAAACVVAFIEPIYLFIAILCAICCNLAAISSFEMGKDWL